MKSVITPKKYKIMIQVLLKGGLGNQMFEYAYALKVKQVHPNEKIFLNGSFLRYSPDKRKIALGNLELDEDTKILPDLPHPRTIIQTLALISKFFNVFGTSSLIEKLYVCSQMLATNKRWQFLKFTGIISLLDKIYKNTCINNKTNTQAHIETDYTKRFSQGLYYIRDYYQAPPVIESTASNKYVWGLFQHVSILDGIEEELRKRFQIKTKASDANKRILEDIKSCNSVCVHIRRGDYLSKPFVNKLHICDEQYYVEAVRQASEQIEKPVFFCFSNDHESIEWIKQNYSFPEVDIRYVDLNNPDYEELRLMMACRHFIISNSTFSWWAAVLSDASPQKKVWAPKVWNREAFVSLNKDSWITL